VMPIAMDGEVGFSQGLRTRRTGTPVWPKGRPGA
jgi:hypothetical protein